MAETVERPKLKILIVVPCHHHLFKDRYVECIKEWLLESAEALEGKPALELTESNIITEGIPPIAEIKKYSGTRRASAGLVITGSFSSIGDDEPWMRELRHTIRLCYVHEVPVVSICFGFQIVSQVRLAHAQALGATFAISPYGYNVGIRPHTIERKALPFFRRYLRELARPEHANHVNGHTVNGNGAVNGNGLAKHGRPQTRADREEPATSVVTVFSHNDVVTSLPNVDNIDFGDMSHDDRRDMYNSLAEMVAIKVSSSDKVPVSGLLVGRGARVFFLALQHHPEFGTKSGGRRARAGQKFFADVLNFKIQQGKISPELVEANTKALNNQNSCHLYGKMAVTMLVNGFIAPEY